MEAKNDKFACSDREITTNSISHFSATESRITKPYVKLSPCLENIFWSLIFMKLLFIKWSFDRTCAKKG